MLFIRIDAQGCLTHEFVSKRSVGRVNPPQHGSPKRTRLEAGALDAFKDFEPYGGQ